MNREFDTFGLVLRMRSMVYSSKDFESLWFLRPVGSKRAELERLTKAEGLPKNISIEEFFAEQSVLKKRLLHKARSSFVPLVARASRARAAEYGCWRTD